MSDVYHIHIDSLEETYEVAQQLATFISPGALITVEGQLGVGKTAFAKAFAKGLGVKEHVTSPTFTIIKEYEGTMPFYHIDAYRLEDAEEDMGFDEYFYGSGVTLIEWAQFIEGFLPKERLEIQMNYGQDEKREWTLKPIGKSYEQLVEKLKQS